MLFKMKFLLMLVAFFTLSRATPEMYKEKEDFQYSRSSTDEGTKSGFYGAQRGNMGGNYEKAHNMDSLAQNQMSGLMNQVHGELGEGAKTKTGDVYTSASTRGIYGQGHYDLSNLSGRNFQEGTSIGDSSSTHSRYSGRSASSAAQHSSAHSSSHSSRNSKYSGASQNSLTSDNLEDTDMKSRHEGYQGYGKSSGYSSGYQSQYNYGLKGFDREHQQSHDSYEDSDRGRVIRYSPLKVMLRPVTRVNLPLTAHTVDNFKNFRIDENNISSDAETADTSRRNSNRNGKTKQYQSSFSYHKEWEKHNTKPMETPLYIPSEGGSTHEQNVDGDYGRDSSDTYNSRSNAHVDENSEAYDSYNRKQSHSKSASSNHESEHQYDQNSQVTSIDANSNAQERSNAYRDSSYSADNIKSESHNPPKKYESSYSYHKSWERRGDPYVIIPESDSRKQLSERLTDATSGDRSSSSHQYGSHQYRHNQGYSSFDRNDCDCDEYGHHRTARSAKNIQSQYNSDENFNQQTQLGWKNYGQQWTNLEDLGQQTQNKWRNSDNFGQETQNNWSNLKDFGQQSHTDWSDGNKLQLAQSNTHNNLEDFGQQSHTDWSDGNKLQLAQSNTHNNLEDFGQQSHTDWSDGNKLQLAQSNTHNNLEDFGQQSHTDWSDGNKLQLAQSNIHNNLEDLSQHSNNDLVQSQVRDSWSNLDQERYSNWKESEKLGQRSQNSWSV